MEEEIIFLNEVNDEMKQEDKLWKEYIKEREKETPKGRKRIFSIKHSLEWNPQLIPFYKSLLLWAYKRGLRLTDKSR